MQMLHFISRHCCAFGPVTQAVPPAKQSSLFILAVDPHHPCHLICMQVLCTTSTLAMGVNLPAHLVVLKGTRRWCSETSAASGYKEYDRSTCLQMIGRAGRPQFDTEGVAVIMTQKQVMIVPSARSGPFDHQLYHAQAYTPAQHLAD